MIRLRFAAHPGPFTVAVQLAQYGFWPSHCEAVLSNGYRLGSWFLKDGVSIQAANYDAGGFDREMFVNLTASDTQGTTFYQFLREQCGKPYDWRAIISFYSKRSGRDWQADDSWFCSELIAAGLAACGLFPQHLAVKFSRITPRDLMLLTSAFVEANGGANA